MKNSVQNLLKKINYIEADVEIQKQILFSIPGDQKKELEKIVNNIAAAKEQILQLREEIKTVSPSEYQKIVDIEDGITKFNQIASQKNFETVENLATDAKCSITLLGGKEILCLVKACDKSGDWTIVTTEGEIITFKKEEILSAE